MVFFFGPRCFFSKCEPRGRKPTLKNNTNVWNIIGNHPIKIEPRDGGVLSVKMSTLIFLAVGWCVQVSSQKRYTYIKGTYIYKKTRIYMSNESYTLGRGGGLGSRPKKMYGERLGDGVEYHLMSPTPRR